MTFGFLITDYQSLEDFFSVSARVGAWEFQKGSWYDEIVPKIADGMCGNTYLAFNDSVKHSISDSDLDVVYEDIRDLCLLLSFQAAVCVTPSCSAPGSFAQHLTMGDIFVPSRAIRGLPSLSPINSVVGFLEKGLTLFRGSHQQYNRLLITHWIGSLTCYTLEDLYLSTCVQFDIVKQVEINILGKKLTYRQGMTEASARLGIQPLLQDATDMRNDLVHEGRLSGSNFPRHTKQDCAAVIADALNWLDEYVIKSAGASAEISPGPRWKATEMAHFLPAFSI